MIALFSGGGIAGVLTHAGMEPDGTLHPDEHVLVLGFNDQYDPICIEENGHTQLRQEYTELILDWRWVPGPGEEVLGHWLTTEEIEAAKGAEQDVEPGA